MQSPSQLKDDHQSSTKPHVGPQHQPLLMSSGAAGQFGNGWLPLPASTALGLPAHLFPCRVPEHWPPAHCWVTS